MILSSRSIARALLVGTVAAALASCNEATAPARRFPVLDDVGQSDWASVSVGGDHTCALKTDGTAYCWGSNQYGQLGVAHSDTLCGPKDSRYGCSLTPQVVQPGVKWRSISAGARHTCAITVDREAYCWGANEQNQVGDFSLGGPTPVKVPGSLPWTQISAGATHTCAVRSDGVLFCWGSNDRGQLGNGSLASGGGSLVRVFSLRAPVASVAAGQQRTCARTTIGTVYCWGAVWIDRENGLEMTRAQTTPQLVPGAPAMASLSVGSFTTCGADASGFAYCWEANSRGEMGNGTLVGSTSPVRVASDLDFFQVSAGIVHSCGIEINGAAYCWGDDTFGQLGYAPTSLSERCGGPTLPCSTVPVPVFGRQQFTQISAGFGSHVCGVTVRGNLYCWGLGVSGQRGDGTESYAVYVPAMAREPR
ncbi:MAG TPA: hypothetical protein VHB25_18155 [Gemmatimonadaceae bacterium]|nr:hypothetical protein [Gemmatimonadaceae bacterium]